MGYVNADLDAGWERVLEQSLATVASRLRDLQFAIAHQGTSRNRRCFSSPRDSNGSGRGSRIM